MTGLTARGNFLYVSSVNQNCAYRYTMPGIVSRMVYTIYSGYSNTRDISMDDDGQIWVASGWTSLPLRLYNAQNTLVDYIGSDLIPHAKGVAMDPEGFLWVSDPENDLIYKIDLQVGIGETPGVQPQLSIRAGANPFVGSVTVFVEGAETASVEIFDLHGRLVARGTARGSFTWDGLINGSPAPSGAYLAAVGEAGGSVATLNLIKL